MVTRETATEQDLIRGTGLETDLPRLYREVCLGAALIGGLVLAVLALMGLGSQAVNLGVVSGVALGLVLLELQRGQVEKLRRGGFEDSRVGFAFGLVMIKYPVLALCLYPLLNSGLVSAPALGGGFLLVHILLLARVAAQLHSTATVSSPTLEMTESTLAAKGGSQGRRTSIMKAGKSLLPLSVWLFAGKLAEASGGGGHAGFPCGHHEGTWLHPFMHLTGLPDWIFISWLIMAVLTGISWLGTSRTRLAPEGLQNLLEFIYEALNDFVVSIMGPKGKEFTPLVGTFFIYILCMNWTGLIPGMLAPTAFLSTTVALAAMAFLMVQYHGIKAQGAKKYFAHFIGEPAWLGPLMLPVHIVGEFAKPLSLAIRLFGNIFGEEKVIFTLIGLSPIFLFIPIPVHFPMICFGVFASFIQALVFAMLTTVYLTMATEHDDHGDGEHAGH